MQRQTLQIHKISQTPQQHSTPSNKATINISLDPKLIQASCLGNMRKTNGNGLYRCFVSHCAEKISQ